MKAHKNRMALNEFVGEYNLKDQYSNIRFPAEVVLETTKNHLETHCEVMVRYDGFNTSGELTLLDTENAIPADRFPEIFKLNYQDFTYSAEGRLVITGTHPTIGAYKVVITPTRDD